MKQCVILTKDEYDSVKSLLQSAIVSVHELENEHPSYFVNEVNRKVCEAYEVLTEETE